MLSCGDDVIPIRDVLHVMRWLSGLNATLEKPDQMAEEVWNMISSREVSERALGMKSILQVWEARQLWRTGGSPITRMYSDLEATDPRDKIYGSLGMTGLNIVPDYSKSVQDVYVEAAKTVMEERFETLLALSGRQTSRSQPIEPLEIPSWVPDWRQSAPGFCSLNHPFTASKNSPTCPAPIIEGYNLYCSGVVCDDVVEIEPVLEPGDCLKFCCDYIGSRTTDRYPTGIPHLRALFLILLADWDTMIDCRSEPESMVYQVIACGLIHLFLSSEISYRARNGRPQISNPFSALGLGAIQSDLATTFWNKVVGTSSEPSNCVITGRYDQQSAAMSAIGERLASTVQAALKPALLNRKIFHTKNGYMGIGSDSVQPGDKVCVAFGCNVPIIFRPQDPYYTCISPCYIVGLMEGEAMLARHDTQRFEIR